MNKKTNAQKMSKLILDNTASLRTELTLLDNTYFACWCCFNPLFFYLITGDLLFYPLNFLNDISYITVLILYFHI